MNILRDEAPTCQNLSICARCGKIKKSTCIHLEQTRILIGCPKEAPFGIIGAQLNAPLKPLNTIVLWWSEGFQLGPQLCPKMPRDASLLGRSRLIAVVFPVWPRIGLTIKEKRKNKNISWMVSEKKSHWQSSHTQRNSTNVVEWIEPSQPDRTLLTH